MEQIQDSTKNSSGGRSKKFTKEKGKNYKHINDQVRVSLIKQVSEEGKNLRDAAEILGINYSTAKTIIRIFKTENRVLKKSSIKKIEKCPHNHLPETVNSLGAMDVDSISEDLKKEIIKDFLEKSKVSEMEKMIIDAKYLKIELMKSEAAIKETFLNIFSFGNKIALLNVQKEKNN